MARRQNGDSTDLVKTDNELEQVRQALVEWRRHHKPPTAIPTELWSKAVELAGRYGVGETARCLQLHHASLKRRMATDMGVLPAPAQFVELLNPVSGNIAECALEVEAPRGARLCIMMKNVAPLGLASIIRDFVR
jgi:hypothetical protein